MSEQQAQPQPPQPPQGQQSSGGGGGGGFFDSFVDNLAEQMGVEWSELQLTDGPWLEVDKIGWRVHNSGNKDVASHNFFVRISGSSGTIYEKDESETTAVPADQYKDFDFSLEDFNKKLEAEHKMGGAGSMPSEWETYRFDLFVDTASGYDKGGSLEFGVDLEESKTKKVEHDKRPRLVKAEVAENAESNDVTFLQQSLQELGYYGGGIDGNYGDTTEEAVKAFKADNTLSADGTVIGDRTWDVLHQRLDERNNQGADAEFPKIKNFRYA